MGSGALYVIWSYPTRLGTCSVQYGVLSFSDEKKVCEKKPKRVRRPGIEPGSKRWQRSIITTRPSALT